MNELHNVDIYNKFFYNTKIKIASLNKLNFFFVIFFSI